jgi:hypothetical protein
MIEVICRNGSSRPEQAYYAPTRNEKAGSEEAPPRDHVRYRDPSVAMGVLEQLLPRPPVFFSARFECGPGGSGARLAKHHFA